MPEKHILIDYGVFGQALITELNEKKKRGIKSFAVLIDPDKIEEFGDLVKLVNLCVNNKVDYIFVGGKALLLTIISRLLFLQ